MDLQEYSETQIKTADQILFAKPEISRVTSLILQYGGSHVRLQDAMSNRAIEKNILQSEQKSSKNKKSKIPETGYSR